MTFERLDMIPGIGEKTANILKEYFKSEKRAIHVIEAARVDILSAIPGIGARQAVNIVKSAFEVKFGVSSKDVLKTKDINKIYEQILGIIQGFASTQYARDKLLLYFPLPPSKIDEILERQKFFGDSLNLLRSISPEVEKTIVSKLRKIRALRRRIPPRKIPGRAIITYNRDVYNKLLEQDVDKWCSVSLLDKGENPADYAEGYNLVFLIPGKGESLLEYNIDYIENIEVLPTDWNLEMILPEKVISFYAINYEIIKAAIEISDILMTFPESETLSQFKSRLDVEKLNIVSELLSKITNTGEVAEGIDPDIDRFRNAIKNFDNTILDLEVWVNEELENRIANSKVSLDGKQILSILQSLDAEETDASALLPPEIIETFSEVTQLAEDKLAKALGLTVRESDWVEGIFSEEISVPIQLNQKKISDLENQIRSFYAMKEYKQLREYANILSDIRDTLVSIVQALLEFDLFFTVGRFGKAYELEIPEINEEYTGIGFEEGINIFLQQNYLRGGPKPIPINYTIGSNHYQPPGTNGERTIILSGANSGGKTSALQTVAHIAILAQMGFPVPAKHASLRIFEELYYFSKSQGMVSAGAFETTLKQFAKIVSSERAKLAMFDEIEAMTEPGAAASVIAGLLEILEDSKSTCTLLVSHLAKEILESTKAHVRVDGIEAKGLDDSLQLIVNRNPRFNYLARSTPELIVERLYRLADSKTKFIYERILKHMKEDTVRKGS